MDIKPVLSFLDHSFAEDDNDSLIDIRYKTKNSVKCIVQCILDRPAQVPTVTK
jgi:hypothetical protein